MLCKEHETSLSLIFLDIRDLRAQAHVQKHFFDQCRSPALQARNPFPVQLHCQRWGSHWYLPNRRQRSATLLCHTSPTLPHSSTLALVPFSAFRLAMTSSISGLLTKGNDTRGHCYSLDSRTESSSPRSMAAEIAEVSFDRFLHGDEADRQAVAQEIYSAFATVGWVYVRDHGIPQERVDDIFKLV